MAISYSKMKS